MIGRTLAATLLALLMLSFPASASPAHSDVVSLVDLNIELPETEHEPHSDLNECHGGPTCNVVAHNIFGRVNVPSEDAGTQRRRLSTETLPDQNYISDPPVPRRLSF